MSERMQKTQKRNISNIVSKSSWGDLTKIQEHKLLKLLQIITSTANLNILLEQIVTEIPPLLNLEWCSVYLTHKYTPQFSEILVTTDGDEVPAISIDKPFVVLAQTNQRSRAAWLGRIFYVSGEDLVGWVYKTSNQLKIEDIADEAELARIHPPLELSQRYYHDKSLTPSGKKAPALLVPLNTPAEIIGVLELTKRKGARAFSRAAEQIAVIVGQVIAGLIQKNQILDERTETVSLLAELGVENDPLIAGGKITASVQNMLNCQHCDLYMLDDKGQCLELKFRDGNPYSNKTLVQFCPGEGLIGWVLKTGKPLLINDSREYLSGRQLDDLILIKISDNEKIDDEDRWLEISKANKSYVAGTKNIAPFIAVPILAPDNSVQGVLAAHNISGRLPNRSEPFTPLELQQVKMFASAFALTVQNDLTRRKADFLLKLNQSESIQELNDLVIKTLPQLIRCSDCFIFSIDRSNDRPPVQLVASSRGARDLSYEIGQSKTGFCALSEKTLCFAHYGAGISRTTYMDAEKERLLTERPNDWIEDLIIDETGNRVGFILLRDGKRAKSEINAQFKQLCETQRPSIDNGLPSPNLAEYLEMGAKPSFSFVAVPIKKREDSELDGVITFLREYAQVPFSEEDIRFVESIASSLASMIDLLKLQNDRKDLLVSLEHEVTRPLTSLRANAEVIIAVTQAGTSLQNYSKKIIEQINLMEMTAETILGVTGGKSIGGRFHFHSIYRPLMDAREIFLEEAKVKGCEIERPHAINSSSFPDVEMRVGELTLAFKNILHNAIKYSFSPPKGQERLRFIRILGDWANTEESLYRISIQNYGVGILKEEIDTRIIFKPFRRGKLSSDRDRTGSGVGLTYVEKIIEDIHHGRVDVISKPIVGEAYLTTFVVVLPVRQIFGISKRGER